MSGRRRVLIVGSYPPIPLAAAAATVAAVRRAWADGDEVTVVSPRLSAAHLAVPVVGVLAGRRLTNVRQYTSTSRAVLVLEPGFPIPTRPGNGPADRLVNLLIQGQTVRALVRAFAGFDCVTLVRVGDLGMPARLEARLVAAAGEVVDHPGRAGAGGTGRGGTGTGGTGAGGTGAGGTGAGGTGAGGTGAGGTGAGGTGAGGTGAGGTGAGGTGAGGTGAGGTGAGGAVTPLGPAEVLPRERPRQLAGLAARTILGRHADIVRARLTSIRHGLKSSSSA